MKASEATAPYKGRKERYEERQKKMGFIKINLRIPKEANADFQIMATVCRENPNLRPAMLRDIVSGKYRKL